MERARVILVAGLLLAACGGSDQTASSDATADTSLPAATADTSRDQSTADTAAETESTTSETSSAPTAEADDTSDNSASGDLQPGLDDLGACHVDITGAETVSWDASGGTGAATVDYWLTEAEHELYGDGFLLILNCVADAGAVILGGSAAATADTIPFGPGRYELPPASAGVDAPNPMVGGVDVTGSEAVWGLDQPGSLEITALDDEHIAGNFSFTATDVLGSVDGQISVTGDFDFQNPNR